MIGNRYRVKEDCFNGVHHLQKDEILTETYAYNFEKECREDGGEYNDIIHNEYGYICDVGSEFAKDNLELVME